MKKIILSAILVAVSLTTFSQIGIGTTSPNASAALDVESTTQGFLMPRMTEVEMNAVPSPAEGLMVYCLDCSPKGIYVNDGTSFATLSGGSTPLSVGTTDTTTAVVEVTGADGGIWMDRNLGASQQATSMNDFNSYGDLYQWGRLKDGHETIVWTSSSTSDGAEQANETSTTVTTSDPGHGNFIIGSSDWTAFGDTLWQAGNDPCPSGYRIPTEAELNGERLNFSPSDFVGAFNSPLKLSLTGNRDNITGSLDFIGDYGEYWTSTVSNGNATTLAFGPDIATMSTRPFASGTSVRCFKE